ncbi:Erythronate-4-phosphate dehydrogenase [Ignavibacterium album JCM 16511]|uniref:Erythronate-4-phosphate dehydrogenase n=1 Tax=Ignavibacterium album (strain DSM 19864 / JCM 16511 / NBRC 101810 / Mat9-16) TaxID=945713 RepID=I0ANV7_IGNAJ|nr:4-phosphoerythronate dehydrogenase [Ignavibacterium album]AFH50664.1 Erythronate-4-phosphate dehydrogenase [Ignavibacterium album JCM 16511]
MKLVVDENIEFAKEAFSLFGQTILLPGREITNEVLKDADILIVRSVTNVGEKLLNGTSVKFVGTATIGTDHIDLNYLNYRNIRFADAKGCNAFAVAEYFLTALMKVCSDEKISLQDKSIGIIGVGNVGSKVAKFSELLGLKILRNDPPLERKNPHEKFYSLDEALQCDIVTLHVPLTFKGYDKTFHLLNENNLMKIKDGAILINTSRGAVVDNKSLRKIVTGKNLHLIFDVWENEPDLDLSLLERVKIGTPHIAGYTLEGKVNGTIIIFDALNSFLGTDYQFDFTLPPVKNNILSYNKNIFDEQEFSNLLSEIYNIETDNDQMKKMLYFGREDRIKYFDTMRKYYPLRREFNNYIVKSDSQQLMKIFKGLRFKVN